MAHIKNSKTLFFVTSPRSPLKMKNEIALLGEFTDLEWNKETQRQYAERLSRSTFYDGKALNTDFSARDRINRAPKAYGFVDLTPRISITSAGNQFIHSDRPHEIFTRQILKFQLPSPYHIDITGEFCVKPFLELIRLIDDINYLTKTELAIFGMQLIDYKKYDDIKRKIIVYRRIMEKVKSSKKSATDYKKKIFQREIESIYASELSTQKFKIRQTSFKNREKFIATKISNANDYADAAIRYLRLTELIVYEKKCIKIAGNSKEDVKFILHTVTREPSKFKTLESYKIYLFDASSPRLLIDDRSKLEAQIRLLDSAIEMPSAITDIEILKDLRQKCKMEKRIEIINSMVRELETYRYFEDIKCVFENIIKRGGDTDLIERPLLFEWNIWRAMAMLDDGEVIGNFSIDDIGMPLYHAPSGKPDIHCKYSQFQLIVEVTLSTGQKQYEMEGEPVARHLGDVIAQSDVDVYCLFIAPEINPATIAHFYTLGQTTVARYGGKAKIIPINLRTFVAMLESASSSAVKPNSNQIINFLNRAYALIDESEDEIDWFNQIDGLAEQWARL